MRLYFTFLLLLSMTFLYGQHQKESAYIPVEITKTDGDRMNVLVSRVQIPKISTFKDVLGGGDVNTKTKIEFRTSESSPVEKIAAKEIAKIVYLDEDHKEAVSFEKLKIKEFDRNGVLKDADNDVFLSCIYDGKIGVYGHPNILCTKNGQVGPYRCEYTYSTFYLKNNGENFAVMPLDINLFDVQRSFDNFVGAFKVAGKDCPAFEKYLASFRRKMEDRNFQKEMRKGITEYKKQVIKQAKDNDLDTGETLDYISRKMFEYEAALYLGIVKEYEKNCP